MGVLEDVLAQMLQLGDFSETNVVDPNNKIWKPVCIMRILFLKFVPEEQT